MDETTDETTTPRPRVKRYAGAVGLLAAGAITGTVLAGTLSANAASSTPSTPSSSSSSTSQSPWATMPRHGSAAHEDAEKAVTGDNAAKAQAAAVKSVGSGTAGAVTTDFRGTGYEVTVTKADGSTVEVHEDSTFTPMTRGGFRGGPGGAPDGAAPSGPAPSGTAG